LNLKFGDWKNILGTCARILHENSEMLSQLDAITGDGDHGVTINKIAKVLDDTVDKWPEDVFLKSLLEDVGYKVMNVNGGSAGPLWGTMFVGFSEGLNEEDNEVDNNTLKSMFEASLKSISEISTAKVGDKTMLDAFIPAVQAVLESKGNVEEMLICAAEAAREGADNTVNYIAKFGRAKTLKEKSLGHKDPGAESIALLLKGFSEGINKN
jgi:dihydroxyacetone kinase-like protein